MKRKTKLFLICLAGLVLVGFLAGYFIVKETNKGDIINPDHETAIVIVTEKYDDYFIADVVGTSMGDVNFADTMKIYVDPGSEFFDNFEALQVGSKVRIQFEFGATFMDEDGRCVVEELYLLKEIES